MVYFDEEKPELTFLLPCLNEEKTLGSCLGEIQRWIREEGGALTGGAEILVVDNGSQDRSAQLARSMGARVVLEGQQGYGSALRAGIRAARGIYVILADADGSYPFEEAGRFLGLLANGAELVVGDRFTPQLEPGAMSWSHRYLGVPLLSMLGRLRYRTEVRDFHCGMRGLRKSAWRDGDYHATGMEFATEMIAVMVASGARVEQCPITFRRDGRDSPSHLRSIRDGLRHLNWMRKNSLNTLRKRSA